MRPSQKTRSEALRQDLERLRGHLETTLAGIERGDGLELSHLAVAMARVQRRIVPPRRPGLVRAALGEACARAADALDGTAWPTGGLSMLASSVALSAREADGWLRGCRRCGVAFDVHAPPAVWLNAGADDVITTTAGPYCSTRCGALGEMDLEIERAIVGTDGGES